LVVPLVASVFAAQSRGGLVSLAVVLPVMLARGDLGRAARRHRVLAVLSGLGLLTVLALVAGKVDERLSLAAVAADKGTGRLDIWHVAWREYLREPLFGTGAGGFEFRSSHLLETTPGVGIDPNSILLRTGIRVHNVYLEALTELGPVGLLLWLAILAGTVAVIVRFGGARVSATPTSPLLPMLFAFAVATVFLSVANSKLLWMIVGLAAAAASDRYAAARTPAAPAPRYPKKSTEIGVARAGRGKPVVRWAPPRAPVTYSAAAAPAALSPSRPQPDAPPGPVGNG